MKTKPKILLAKMGLDGHDNGIRIVSKWLMDAGYEVVYLGIYNTPQGVVRAALEENVAAIGVSFLGGEHLFYVKKLMDELNKQKVKEIKLLIGGVIPPGDETELKGMGVAAVFTPGTLREDILKTIDKILT